MDAEENEFMARMVQRSIADGEKFQRAIEGQKTLFRNLADMERDRNAWKARAEKAEAEVRRLLILSSRPIDSA
jgi:hypothetical protein